MCESQKNVYGNHRSRVRGFFCYNALVFFFVLGGGIRIGWVGKAFGEAFMYVLRVWVPPTYLLPTYLPT